MKKPRKNSRFSNRRPVEKEKTSFGADDMDDEIDAFHKQRDMIPIDANDDSDEDGELPVYDFKGLNEDTDDTDDGDSGDDVSIARQDRDHEKMIKQQRSLQKKYGAVENDLSDDSDQKEKQKASFTRGRQYLYGADNIDFELQSDEEDLVEEEAIAVMLQKEKAKSLSAEDFGLEDVRGEDSHQEDEEQTLQTVFMGKSMSNKADISDLLKDEAFGGYEEIKKDINALTKEEQMDIVYRSAPELVGLLSELTWAVEEVYTLKPLLLKARNTKGIHYFETKHKLLLLYLQAITFYLLLKSEGHTVRDHPVIAHLVELKNLMERVKKIDATILPLVGEIGSMHVSAIKSEDEKKEPDSDSDTPADTDKSFYVAGVSESTGNGKPIDDGDANPVPIEADQKNKKNVHVGSQSLQMLKVRELLEQKLKQKGIFDSVHIGPAGSKNVGLKKAKRQADFEGDAADCGASHGENGKLSVCVPAKIKMTRLASGDDDLPKRESIGEKRRKYDLRAVPESDAGQMIDDNADKDADTKFEDGEIEGEDEFYQQVKRQRLTNLSAKAALYTRNSDDALRIETEADGRRRITTQMEKNKGLTRHRKKLTKNPRKKYKLKHAKAVVRRKGQVRDIRKPEGSYSGEASGINTRVSRSTRL